MPYTAYKSALLALAWLPVAAAADEPARLQVMLQGDSAEQLGALVRQTGGEVTHDLPIINAVGALLTAEQLGNALQSPLVARYLDDLNISEEPEQPTDGGPGACAPRGALELERDNASLRWRLYAKGDSEARLLGLQLNWPQQLGAATAVSVDGKSIPDSALQEHGVQLQYESADAPALLEPSVLEIRFDPELGQAVASVPQRLLEFSARFGDDCDAQLIPGYDNNDGDSYYPTVVGADALHGHGVTGAGVTVAILDSGLWEAEAIAQDTRGQNRILARFDAITGEEVDEAFDGSGHGTHLASAIANSSAVAGSGSYKGVAPDAALVAIKAFNDQGQGGFLDIVRGIQWAVDNREKHNIRVLNLSFAAPPRWPYWEDPINQALMRAWREGITVIAAAGNEGPANLTVGSPGNLPYIITVGAVTDSWTVDDRSDDYIPDFSSQGPTPNAHIKPDIVAPGGHVIGITRPGATLTQQHPEYMLSNGNLVMTGTSQAAAVVSGIVALLLQMQPQLQPDDIKCKLTTSAEPAINRDGRLSYTPFQQGHGYVSAIRALTLGQSGCGNSDLDIVRDMEGGTHFQGPSIVDERGKVSLPGLHLMVAPKPPAKGPSDDRVWGVKAHIERRDINGQKMINRSPFNWDQRYAEERQAIEAMAKDE